MGNKEEGRRQFSHPLTPGHPTDREKRYQTNPNICCLGQKSIDSAWRRNVAFTDVPQEPLGRLVSATEAGDGAWAHAAVGRGTLITESNGRCSHRS